ncbi:MAG TPA: hypothetical protein VLL51_07920, partial [Gemmatimonadales bacterium]|nr:hypothetical protein [Gemmatimonadales bacterium]
QAKAVAAYAEAQRPFYPGHWIVQEYARSNRDYDCRVAVGAGEILYAFGRSLVRGNDADPEPWLASVSRGSSMFSYQPSSAEIELAIRASQVVEVDLNELDMGFTSRGPVIIEHNPTPQFVDGENPGHFTAFVAALRSLVDRRSLHRGRGCRASRIAVPSMRGRARAH